MGIVWSANGAGSSGQQSEADVGSPDSSENVKYGDLVLSALPVLRRASDSLSHNYGPRDKRSGYLNNIQSSARLLEDHLDKIGSIDGFQEFDDQIGQLACCLEEIFDALRIADQPDQEEMVSMVIPFPRLLAVYKATKKQDCELLLQGDPDSSHVNDLNTWKTLHNKLERLTDELEPIRRGDNFDDTEGSKLPKMWLPPDESDCQFFDRALGAVLCKCSAHHMRTLRLRIGTYRRGPVKPKPKPLCVLLSLEAKVGEWYELFVHDDTSGSLGVSGQSKGDICNCLKMCTDQEFRLDLNLQQSLLSPYNRPPNKRTLQAQSLQGQIDLKSLLSLEGRKWNTETKWALAVLLAYALLYVYGGSHFRGLWKRENIMFFHDGYRIPLRPFLGTLASRVPRRDNDPAPPSRLHRHPDIVMLGVMLLEIYLGQRLESFLGMENDITDDNDFYLKAWKAYRRPESRTIPGRYMKVIHACIDPQNFQAELDRNDHRDDKMRTEFFQRIIRPLDEDVLGLFKPIDIFNLDDAVATKCDLACGLSLPLSTLLSAEISSLNQGTPEKQDILLPAINDNAAIAYALPSGECQPADSGHAQTDPNTPSLVVSGTYVEGARPATGSPFSTSSPSPGLHLWREDEPVLFDANIVEGGRKAVDSWKKWFGDFDEFRRRILPPQADDDNERRVRVTIIDTGIDGSHPFIQKAGWSKWDEYSEKSLFYDFADGVEGRDRHEPIDEDGHGTFIAGLLLQAAPGIELSVARIGLTREHISQDPAFDTKLMKAIQHAIGTWEAEIISMSFGKMNPSDDLRYEVEEVLKGETILLAATGNSGITKPMSFPASQNGVFKIFATDMVGGLTSFSSPPTRDADQHYCFAIPGHQTVSVWPLGLLQRAKDHGLDVFCWDPEKAQPRSVCEHADTPCDWRTVMSGTSFATPIAAALVAVIYQFYNVNKDSSSTRIHLKAESEKRPEGKERFKTSEAVRAILDEMSRTCNTHQYNFLTPSYGRRDRMRFIFNKQESEHAKKAVNVFQETPEQFFARRLSEILERI